MDISFLEYISTLDVPQLQDCRSVITKLITEKITSPRKSSVNAASCTPPKCKSVDDYVEYQTDFITAEKNNLLKQELKTLNFNKYAESDAVQNKFISSHNEPYIWKSSVGPVINEASEFDSFPELKSLMAKINAEYGLKLNCVLVSYFKNGSVNLRRHSDDESSLDKSQPICLVSLGVPRRVEFLSKERESFRGSDLVLNPADSSIYTMKAGCQELYYHRVRMWKQIQQERIGLSFRCFIPMSERVPINPPFPSTPIINIRSTVDTTTPLAPFTPVKPSNGLLPPSTSDFTREISPITSSTKTSYTEPGFSPFVPKKSVSFSTSDTISSNQSKGKSDEKICLILGTSISVNVDGVKMSRGSRTVVNCSMSGANIRDVSKLAGDFYHENRGSVYKVDKIIINVGTNEIKWFNSCRNDVYKRFRSPLTYLIRDIKSMYPQAQIIFQSVLPIRIFYTYTAKSVHEFNHLLIELCQTYGCIFLDSFGLFLDSYQRDINSELYRDKWHLNDAGIKILCRELKYAIYRNIFNPLPRLCHKPYY